MKNNMYNIFAFCEISENFDRFEISELFDISEMSEMLKIQIYTCFVYSKFEGQTWIIRRCQKTIYYLCGSICLMSWARFIGMLGCFIPVRVQS